MLRSAKKELRMSLHLCISVSFGAQMYILRNTLILDDVTLLLSVYTILEWQNTIAISGSRYATTNTSEEIVFSIA